jgi:transposase-like protein
MTRPNFTEEFKIDAIKQITERGYSVADVSKRLIAALNCVSNILVSNIDDPSS